MFWGILFIIGAFVCIPVWIVILICVILLALAVCGLIATDAYREEIEKVLQTLTPREEKVIRLRYGLDDNRPRTLEEVGKEFNVTRERIRQIEAKAIRRLRHPSRLKRLEQHRVKY